MSSRSFRRVCVFCGSSQDVSPRFFQAARAVGRGLAQRNIALVYGGGRAGLMGAVADAALEAGGQVLGVIPQKLDSVEQTHHGLTELFVVDSMRARKAMMAHLSNAFIALPGGFGTLEELFEVVTLTQLRYHDKPVGLLNVDGYYDAMLDFLRVAHIQGFIRPAHRDLIQVSDDLGDLLSKLSTCDLPDFPPLTPRA